MLQKEDVALAQDIEVLESHVVITMSESCNMYDTPLEVYRLCFPNEKDPKGKLTNIYRRLFASHLTADGLSIKQIEAIVTTSKRGMSKLDMDIYVKMCIEGEFQYVLEEETHLSWEEIIGDSNPDTLRDRLEDVQEKVLSHEKMVTVKTRPERLSDQVIYSNKYVTGKAWLV